MRGGYFTGYLLDLSMDADSELICAVETLADNGDEGADAKALIEAEERAHGNDVAGLSIYSAGFRGEVLHDLTEAEDGPRLEGRALVDETRNSLPGFERIFLSPIFFSETV